MTTKFLNNSLNDDRKDQENNPVTTTMQNSTASILESLHEKARSCNRALETMRVELMIMTTELNIPSPSLSIEQETLLNSEIEELKSDLDKMKV